MTRLVTFIFLKLNAIQLTGVLIIIFLLHINASAQTLKRQSFSSLGASVYNEGVILRQTLGQPSNTYLFSSNGILLRQGFQQPFSIFQDIESQEPIEFIVFPNPTTGKINLNFNYPINNYNIRIESIMGSLLKSIENQTFMINEIELYGLKPGIYFITIQSGRRWGTERIILTR